MTKEKAPATPTTSWWLNTATFYAEARKRFPLTTIEDNGFIGGWKS
jgi:hypothetical protein